MNSGVSVGLFTRRNILFCKFLRSVPFIPFHILIRTTFVSFPVLGSAISSLSQNDLRFSFKFESVSFAENVTLLDH